MTQKLNNSKEIQTDKQKTSLWSIKISGVSLPLYLIMLVILIIGIKLDKLPGGILGALAVLVLLGNLFYYIGNHLVSLSLTFIS